MDVPSSPIRWKLTTTKDECGRSNIPSVTNTTRNSAVHPTLLPGSEAPPINTRKTCTRALMDSTCVTVCMSLLTVYILFADDIRVLATTASYDDVFYAVATACLCVFAIEIVICVYCKPEYRNSFYFYLDVLSTVFLVTDIGWVWSFLTMSSSNTPNTQVSQVKHASKSSQTAARGVKLVRIVRIIRLMRLVKLYQNTQTAFKRKDSPSVAVVPADNSFFQESNVGKRLSELTTKRVIFLVLVLLVMLPLFDSELYFDPPSSSDFSLVQLMKYHGSMGFLECLDEMREHHSSTFRPLLLLSYTIGESTAILTSSQEISELRLDEMYFSADGDFVGIFDIRMDVRLAAGLSICRTVFVAIVMGLAAIYFTQDAQKLVISPIEKMMRKVSDIAKDPIKATEEKANDLLEEEEEKPSASCCSGAAEVESNFETKLLEDTLLKISTLLCLGFGEAGAKMISQNLAKHHQLDLMLDGTKVMGIFGFCDIRNFTDTTEVLKEDVMLFVNQIASIVHGTVANCLGAANKNIGDAFLLVWKFEQEDVLCFNDDIRLDPASPRVKNLCDLALVSFIQTIVKIATSPHILEYRKHPALLKRLPGYTVKMGFGLHLGWAIEGAIGSDLKIDASYLSPHVNMASRLEAATKQYGVGLLLSGSLVSHLGSKARAYCRHIDTVTVKGSSEPVGIYTVDVDASEVVVRHEGFVEKRIAIRRRNDLRVKIQSSEFDALSLLENTRGMAELRKNVSVEFISEFKTGVECYISGDWMAAKERLNAALLLKERDGPSVALLEVMTEMNFQPPKDWNGVRALMEK